MVLECKSQKLPDKFVAWSDADFAGHERARRNTAGGVIVLGDHCIKTYSSTQDIVALPSGEVEFYGIVKGGSHGFGVGGILRDLGLETRLQINTDSSAVKSIVSRRGAGKGGLRRQVVE